MELNGRVALVTGAGRGIGAAIAGRLAEAGVDVAVGYESDRTAAEEQTARISEMGRRALAVGGDVSDPAALEKMAGIVESELGPVDILVSNAGVAPQQGLEENVGAVNIELTDEDMRRIEEVAPVGAAAGERYNEAGMQTVNR